MKKPPSHRSAVLSSAQIAKGRAPARPELLVFDFDGVLTDNRVLVLEDGKEGVFCNRSDGLAFDLFRKSGIPALILSTEANPVVAARARKLRVPHLQGVSNKAEALVQHCASQNIQMQQVLYAGNDLNDYEVMGLVGWPVCPSDAHPRIKRICRTVLRTRGGDGVAREIAERLLHLEYPLAT